MKRTSRIGMAVLALFLVGILSSFSTTPVRATPINVNYVTNPGAELGSTAGWTPFPGAWIASTKQKFQGSYSFSVNHTFGGSTPSLIQTPTVISVNASVVVAGALRCNKTTNGAASIYYDWVDGSYNHYYLNYAVTADSKTNTSNIAWFILGTNPNQWYTFERNASVDLASRGWSGLSTNDVYLSTSSLVSGTNEAFFDSVYQGYYSATPTLTTPADDGYLTSAAKNVSWTISANPIGASQGSYLQIASNPSFSSPLVNIHTGTDTTYMPNLAGTGIRTWHWRVKCYDSLGNGTWSQPLTFNIEYPRVLSLSPTNDTYLLNATQLSWQPAIANYTPIQGYYMQLSRYVSFSTLLVNTDIGNITSYTPNLAGTGIRAWYWRVKIYDNIGNGSWTSPGSFNIEYPRINTQSPSNGTYLLNATQLSWQPAIANYTPLQGHYIQLSQSATFSTTLVNTNLGNITSYQPNLAGTNVRTWFWRIKPYDNVGNGSWTSPGSFNMEYPRVLSLIPSNGTIVSTWTTAALSWQPAIANYTCLRGYYLQISRYATFSSLTFNANIQNVTAYSATLTIIYTSPWYWRVRPYDNVGNGSWTSAGYFYLLPCNMTQPQLTATVEINENPIWSGKLTYYGSYTEWSYSFNSSYIITNAWVTRPSTGAEYLITISNPVVGQYVFSWTVVATSATIGDTVYFRTVGPQGSITSDQSLPGKRVYGVTITSMFDYDNVSLRVQVDTIRYGSWQIATETPHGDVLIGDGFIIIQGIHIDKGATLTFTVTGYNVYGVEFQSGQIVAGGLMAFVAVLIVNMLQLEKRYGRKVYIIPIAVFFGVWLGSMFLLGVPTAEALLGDWFGSFAGVMSGGTSQESTFGVLVLLIIVMVPVMFFAMRYVLRRSGEE